LVHFCARCLKQTVLKGKSTRISICVVRFHCFMLQTWASRMWGISE
jgi:hypothetical protein